MKIIVTGSLGNIGKPLTEALVKKGNEVIVISSNAGKQKDIEALGAKAAIGSLDDADFLTKTFNGADAVFAMVPPNFKATDSRAYYQRTGKNYVQAIKHAGVKRVVHLSSIGAHLDAGTGFILGSHDTESLMNDIDGISLTHLRPGYFYTNLLNFADMIKGAGFIGANYGGDDKLVMAHPKDIAEAAAQELATPGRNKIRYVVSDERRANEVATILGEAIGKPDLKWMTLSDEQMKQGMEQAGLPAQIIEMFVEMGGSIHSGILMEHYEQQQTDEKGKRKIEEFVNENKSAFK